MFRCYLTSNDTNWILVFRDEEAAWVFAEATKCIDNGHYICCANGYCNGVMFGKVEYAHTK